MIVIYKMPSRVQLETETLPFTCTEHIDKSFRIKLAFLGKTCRGILERRGVPNAFNITRGA